MSSYQYNGLGDRLSQTVDSVPTNYTLDLNSGLTQVLSDGTNTYLYGNGRIAQKGSTTEFFLGDVLGSVRQMTDVNAEITLAKNYAPYGETMSSVGNGASPFAYTGEQVDSNGLVYLRARYYSGDTGRFLTRDTWEGNSNQPMSYNLWNYVQSNPILNTDPTGQCSYPPTWNIDYVEKNSHLAKAYWLNTYVAAGIAVQCWAVSGDKNADEYSGKGDAQTTDIELRTPWGEAIKELEKDGKTVKLDKNGQPNIIAYGKLCYIVNTAIGDSHRTTSCTICDTYDKLVKEYGKGNVVGQETPVDQTTNGGAVTSMRRRISQVLDNCTDCTDTDRFIAAALAQDVQLNSHEMADLSNKNPNAKASRRFLQETNGLNIDWYTHFKDRHYFWSNDTNGQVGRFADAIAELKKRDWSIPTKLVDATIYSLR